MAGMVRRLAAFALSLLSGCAGARSPARATCAGDAERCAQVSRDLATLGGDSGWCGTGYYVAAQDMFFQGPKAAPLLAAALDDSNVRVRQQAARVLWDWGRGDLVARWCRESTVPDPDRCNDVDWQAVEAGERFASQLATLRGRLPGRYRTADAAVELRIDPAGEVGTVCVHHRTELTCVPLYVDEFYRDWLEVRVGSRKVMLHFVGDALERLGSSGLRPIVLARVTHDDPPPDPNELVEWGDEGQTRDWL